MPNSSIKASLQFDESNSTGQGKGLRQVMQVLIACSPGHHMTAAPAVCPEKYPDVSLWEVAAGCGADQLECILSFGLQQHPAPDLPALMPGRVYRSRHIQDILARPIDF
jgi:hypothetical protein